MPDQHTLAARILDVLREASSPLDADQITLLLICRYDIDATTTDVNAILYGMLRDRVKKDDRHCWHLIRTAAGADDSESLLLGQSHFSANDDAETKTLNSVDQRQNTRQTQSVDQVVRAPELQSSNARHHAAREIEIDRGQRSIVPPDYTRVRPGNCSVTRYLKAHAETIYVERNRPRPGCNAHTAVLFYHAPRNVVTQAKRAAEKRAKEVQQKAEVKKLRSLLGAAADRAKEVFLSLDEVALRSVFASYSNKYGKKKCDYARRAYDEWKANTRAMSPEISVRLLELLPQHLTFDQRYDIFELLWRHARPKDDSRFTVDSQSSIDSMLEDISHSLKNAQKKGFPDGVTTALAWLSEDQTQDAELIVRHLNESENRIIISKLRVELKKLVSFVSTHSGRSSAESVLELPGHRITITVVRGFHMSEDNREFDGKTPQDWSVTPADGGPNSRSLVPIENPNNLLEEALRRVRPEKVQEIIDKAADKALELQAKKREAEIDNDIVQDKLDMASRHARIAAETPGVEYVQEIEHRSEHGYTRAKITGGARREVKGSCFIATACFGEFDHPTVVTLREFRDNVLLESRPGRWFVTIYYGIGPWMARLLDLFPVLKAPLRTTLTAFARRYRRSK